MPSRDRPQRKRVKRNQVPMADSSCKVGVVLDRSSETLMHQRSRQVFEADSSIHTVLGDLQAPLQMYMTSLEGVVLEEMSKHDGYRAWTAVYETNFIDVLPKESLFI